jgi:hypothetical protein
MHLLLRAAICSTVCTGDSQKVNFSKGLLVSVSFVGYVYAWKQEASRVASRGIGCERCECGYDKGSYHTVTDSKWSVSRIHHDSCHTASVDDCELL